jgi:hypothetical protein
MLSCAAVGGRRVWRTASPPQDTILPHTQDWPPMNAD